MVYPEVREFLSFLCAALLCEKFDCERRTCSSFQSRMTSGELVEGRAELV